MVWSGDGAGCGSFCWGHRKDGTDIQHTEFCSQRRSHEMASEENGNVEMRSKEIVLSVCRILRMCWSCTGQLLSQHPCPSSRNSTKLLLSWTTCYQAIWFYCVSPTNKLILTLWAQWVQAWAWSYPESPQMFAESLRKNSLLSTMDVVDTTQAWETGVQYPNHKAESFSE